MPGHKILLAVHIDDFIIVCADRATLDDFRLRLLKAFAGTYEGAVQTYLGCEIISERDLTKGTTRLSQTHYSIDILKTFGHWDSTPAPTPMIPNTRLRKEA